MYKFIQSSEEINSNSGFSFINKLLNGNKGMACRERLLPAARNSRYSTSAIIRSLIGILTAGECDYADIEKFRDDFLFRGLVCGDVPSQESFRQRLGRLASRSRDEWREAIDGCVASQLSSARLTPLHAFGKSGSPQVEIPVDELEALRLCDLEERSQKDAASEMNISRGMLQRLLYSAHRKTAFTLLFGRCIRTEGGSEADFLCTRKGRCRFCAEKTQPPSRQGDKPMSF